MKKLLLVIFGIALTTTSAFALVDHYKTFKAGKYTCPESDNRTCVIHKYKTEDIEFEQDCFEDKDSRMPKYAPMIKRGQCKYSEDKNKYYVCEFADAKCEVIFSNTTKISCSTKKTLTLTPLEQEKISKKITNFAKEGKCREMFPSEPVKTSKNVNKI